MVRWRIVSKVEIVGRGPVLLEMSVSEPDGDATVTFFDRVEADRVFSDAEIASLFGGGAPARNASGAAAPAETPAR